ncbi:carbohydrate ABC transporter permease [Clostridium manihotivorum]|uniref:Carbohydrate ABC transporter permease n=1 Tax=Clostridium manihotivorum TaxID=2320868 RepID=A0A410DTC7_9CLOT|nr:carbohydrate ABC transporter permease [Clostridium manihotivorum]QAA32319.1 carbohydrate ABC transporter permease [Clostridium manihotivorum]
MTVENKFLTVIKYIVLCISAIFALAPVVYIISGSFMGQREVAEAISRNSFHFIPNSFTLIQYYEVFLRKPDFLLKFLNSLILTIPIILGQIVVSVLGAYAFAKIEFPFKNQFFFGFVLLMIMPYQVTLVPTYILMKKLNLIGTYTSVIFPNIFSTFGVFLLTQFMKSIPEDQCQSAKIDGASHLKVLLKIIIPQCKSSIASLGILCFIDNWNMIEQPLILLNDNQQPLSTYLPTICNNPNSVCLAFACAVIFILPAVFIFIKGEKLLLEGIQHLDSK